MKRTEILETRKNGAKSQTVRQTKDVELTSPDVSVSQGASSIHLTRNTSFSCRRVLRITNALPK